MKKMGSLSSILDMIPGMGGKISEADAQEGEKQLRRTESIILSMTPAEREKPSLMNPSRKRRIAAGCGLEVVDVNRLLKQFEMMQQLTKQLSKGKLPKGMGGFGGGMSRMHGFGRKKRLK